MELVEDAREEFLNLCSPREEKSDGRASTRTARSAEGTRAWSDLFVRDILPERTTSVDKNPSSPNNAEVENNAGVANITGVENSAGVGNNAGVKNSAGVGNNAGTQNSAGVQNSAGTQQNPQHTVIMAGPKEKLPKFDGDEATDPI